MSRTLIVEKCDPPRLAFTADAHAPLLFDALWPSIGFNYLYWSESIDSAVLQAPWNYVIRDNKIVYEPSNNTESARENAARARLLMQLARATNRHRRQFIKEDLLGQDLVYGLKAQEAQRFLTDVNQRPEGFPWLQNAASFEGLTMEQSARQIIFRYTQAQELLNHTENQRRMFTRRILTTPWNQLETVANELRDYERRG
jgi:hypothetical protein